MRVFAQTDIGKQRPINEDAYYLPLEGERFCAIADGMGGHNAGEVASAMAVKAFAESMRRGGSAADALLHRAVNSANAEIFQKSCDNPELAGMGTTFTALMHSEDEMHIAHVGDSRAYLLRNGTILRLTVDHTLVEEMVIQGLITPREAKHHPKRNYITRALGTAEHVNTDLLRVSLLPGDVFLLCTDGLSNHVDEKEMLEISGSDRGWDEKLRTMIELALRNGGTDNITAMYAVTEDEHQ